MGDKMFQADSRPAGGPGPIPGADREIQLVDSPRYQIG